MIEERIKAALDKYKDVSFECEPFIDTEREQIPLVKCPTDLDFVKTTGGTTYTVRSHFNPAADECLFQIVNRLMFGDSNLRVDDYE